MERRSTIAISEYKPPRALSPQLRAGLRELDIMDVVANHKIPVEEEAKSYYYATELVASAVTQTFHYMVKSGLAYGLLTTGEGIVLLKIDWDDPRTVYYHLAEPAEEVVAHANYRACSAVSQYLGFHLLALSDYSHRGQDVRDRAIKGLTTWTTDFRKAASTLAPSRGRRACSDAAIWSSDEIDSSGEGGRGPDRRSTPSPSEGRATQRSARLAAHHSDGRG
ncbi:hypothetical protein F4808DRAFT_445272, partial [Astrocystis sublimbata]